MACLNGENYNVVFRFLFTCLRFDYIHDERTVTKSQCNFYLQFLCKEYELARL
jgi:hypothetical protein